MNNSTIECYEELYKTRCKELIDYGLALEELNKYENYEDLLTKDGFRLVINRKENRKHKRNRVKKKYIELYKLYQVLGSKNKKIVFGTITLNDYYLGLKENTYIRNVHKWLKNHFLYSIVNKDYGSKNEREHYHFIGLTTELIETKCDSNGKPIRSKKGYEIKELVKKDYKMGFEPTLCEVNLEKDSLDKTISYLLKLNNHSTKMSTRNRIRVLENDIVKVLFMREKE